MVTFNGYDIQLTRGDSLYLRLDLDGRDLPAGTDAVLTVKKNIRTDEVLLRKRFDASDEVVGVLLSPSETSMKAGSYVWDVRLHIPLENGGYEVYTPMEYAAFVVLETVGNIHSEDEDEVTPYVPLLQLTLNEANAAIAQARAAAETASSAASQAQAYTLPAFWAAEVESAVNAVRAHQDECGARGVCFVLCSDLHVHDNDQNYTRNLGHVAAAVMDRAQVPLMVNCGDLMTNDSVAQENWIRPCYDRAWQYLKPVRSRLLLLQGNHDGAWGAYTAEDSSTAYDRNLSPNRLWQYLFRPQTMDRVCGPTGTYFYTDLTAQKTRLICLNSHDGVWSENADGTAVWNTMTGGYGPAQLNWLAQEALNVPEGWCILLFSHIPPTNRLPTDYSAVRCAELIRGIVSAYAQRTSYTGSYTHDAARGEDAWADASVSVNFAGAQGEIAGWFCGHAHRDAIIADDLPFPIVTITCAANVSYDTNAPLRIMDTVTETALDVVTVDRLNKTIFLTRLGAGSDRSCGYAEGSAPSQPDTPPPAQTGNLLPLATDHDGTIYNGVGWKEGYRISASTGSVSANANTDLTGYIPVAIGDTVTLTGILMPEKTPNVGVHFYSARGEGNKMLSVAGWDGVSGFPGNGWTCTRDGSNITSFVVPDWTEIRGVMYMRIAASEITSESAIMVEAGA